MGKRRGGLVTFIFRSIDPSLRRFISSYLVEVAPLTFAGGLSSRVRDEVWDFISDGEHEATLVYFSGESERGLVVRSSNSERYITDSEGLLLGRRRLPFLPVFKRVLGKSLPQRYELWRHLLDSAACGFVVFDNVLSVSQRRLLSEGLGLSEEDVRRFVGFVVGMHDIGKAHRFWQPVLGVDSEDLSVLFTDGGSGLPVDSIKGEARLHQVAGFKFFELGQSFVRSNVRDDIGDIVAAHHGFYPSESLIEVDYSPELFEDEGWVKVRQDVERLIANVVGVDEVFFDRLGGINDDVKILLTGVVVLCDWVASRASFISSASDSSDEFLFFQDALLRAGEFFNYHHLNSQDWVDGLGWGDVYDFEPNGLQRSLVDFFDDYPEGLEDGGIMILCSSMGSGKTEAAVYAAAKWGAVAGQNGVWFNLPTQSTADVFFGRAVSVASKLFRDKKVNVSLMHSNSTISAAVEGIARVDNYIFSNSVDSLVMKEQYAFDGVDEKSGVQAGVEDSLVISEFLVEKKLGGMSSISISTVDQCLATILKLKHGPLRLTALTGKVIVLDEVHDFDSYTFGLIKKLVRYAGYFKLPVIAMSATLSEKAQQDLLTEYYLGRNGGRYNQTDDGDLFKLPYGGVDSPGWVWSSGETTELVYSPVIEGRSLLYDTSVVYSEDRYLDVLNHVRDSWRRGLKTLVVCNTVDESIGFYSRLKEDLNLSDDRIDLLHSRKPQFMKQQVIDKVLLETGKNSVNMEPYVLVSTQIVQQSLDIDFDVLVTMLSPLDSLIQKTGRVFRHPKSGRGVKKPEVIIIVDKIFFELLNVDDEDKEIQCSMIERAEKIGRPYRVYELLKTLKVINDLLEKHDVKEIDFQGDIKKIVAKYHESDNASVLKIAYEKYNSSIADETQKSRLNEISNPRGVFEKMIEKKTMRSKYAPKTRLIEQKTVTVLFVVEETIKGWRLFNGRVISGATPRNELYRQIGLNSIEIPEYLLKNDKQPISLLNKVISVPEYVKIMDFNEPDIKERFHYDHKAGLIINPKE